MKTTAHYQRTVPFTSRVALPLLAAGSLFGQAVPPAPPVLPAAYAEIVELSPFTVNATADKGYRAENTLAGSRLNSSLRDTPSSISVFTKKFLEDLGINQIEDFVGYTVGSTLAVQDTNAAPNANAAINGQSLVRGIDIRGIGASQGIDYFKNITPNEGYRIGRYDESRGPNGILFASARREVSSTKAPFSR